MVQEQDRCWLEIVVETTPEAGEMVGELLLEIGCGGVVYHDPRLYEREKAGQADELFPARLAETQDSFRVAGYLPSLAGWEERMAKLQARLTEIRAFLPVGTGKITLNRLQEDDWATAWKTYYHPEKAGKFIIIPSWLPQTAEPGEIVIKLDPGMAFGTGSHPTTRLSLELLQETVTAGALVYDLGAGSGILAIAAAKLGAKVKAVDIDPLATEIAAKNIAQNQVSAAVQVLTGDLLSNLEQPADLIIANIIAEVIVRLIPAAVSRLKPGGALLVSGIISGKADLVLTALEKANFTIVKSLHSEDWLAYLATKNGGEHA